MSKRKTRQEKIIADLHRKLQLQTAVEGQSLHQTHTYHYKHPTQTTAVAHPNVMITNISSIKHDLLKTTIVTVSILATQLLLFYLLKNHVIRIPMVGY